MIDEFQDQPVYVEMESSNEDGFVVVAGIFVGAFGTYIGLRGESGAPMLINERYIRSIMPVGDKPESGAPGE